MVGEKGERGEKGRHTMASADAVGYHDAAADADLVGLDAHGWYDIVQVQLGLWWLWLLSVLLLVRLRLMLRSWFGDEER